MVLYSAKTKTWTDLHTFDVPGGFWTWPGDSKSIYMVLVPLDREGNRCQDPLFPPSVIA
jgi:hypothetical protein